MVCNLADRAYQYRPAVRLGIDLGPTLMSDQIVTATIDLTGYVFSLSDHFDKTGIDDKSRNARWRCRYCCRDFISGSTRLKSHLSGVPIGGQHISACLCLDETGKIGRAYLVQQFLQSDAVKRRIAKDSLEAAAGPSIIVTSNSPTSTTSAPATSSTTAVKKRKAYGDPITAKAIAKGRAILALPLMDHDYPEMMNHASSDEPVYHSGVSFKSSFNLRSDLVHQTLLDNNILLRMEKMGRAVGRIYFVDNGVEVDVPEGITVHDDTNRISLKPAPLSQYFVVSWTIDYSVHYKGEVIVVLSSQQQWAIRGPAGRNIDSIEM